MPNDGAHACRPRRAAAMALVLTLTASALAASPDAQGWLQFRGPWGNGHAAPPGSSAAVGLPLEWSESRNVVWKTPIPHRGWSTPVGLGGRVWLTTATPDGHAFFAIGVDAATGEPVWRERISGNYAASPILADGRLYFLSRQGTATVMAAGRTVRVLATNRLESGFMASPAVAGGALFLRTKTHLYRVEDRGQARGE
ncbi:MAG: PQQ-binding-like beta-propeller repeat protein [Phycisphaerae bacterium]